MIGPRLDVAVVLPERLDLYGDAANAAVLRSRAAWEGVDLRVNELRAGDPLPPVVDLWLVGSAGDETATDTLEALARFRSRLQISAAAGEIVLAVGLGWDLLAEQVEFADDGCRDGLGIFPGNAWLLPRRASGELVSESPWGTLIGYENHARGYYDLSPGREIGRVLHGTGNGDGSEGGMTSTDATLFGTHLHGPVLAKNPRLTDALLATALSRRHGSTFAAVSPESRRADSLVDRMRRSILTRARVSAPS